MLSRPRLLCCAWLGIKSLVPQGPEDMIRLQSTIVPARRSMEALLNVSLKACHELYITLGCFH